LSGTSTVVRLVAVRPNIHHCDIYTHEMHRLSTSTSVGRHFGSSRNRRSHGACTQGLPGAHAWPLSTCMACLFVCTVAAARRQLVAGVTLCRGILSDWVSLWSWVHAPCSASGHCPHRRSLTAALKTMPWLKRLLCHRPDARASRYSPPLSPCSRFYSLLCATVQLSAPLVLAVVTDPPIVMRLIGSCTVARVAVAHSPRVRRRSGTATPATTAVMMSAKPFPLLASRQMAVRTVDRAAR
jgi:hypothetical protein